VSDEISTKDSSLGICAWAIVRGFMGYRTFSIILDEESNECIRS
jgi:hypothetical protein